MIIEIQWPESVPRTEFSQWFVQLMANRMSFSFFKYGTLWDAYPGKMGALENVKERIRVYKETANTEYLVDAANFLLIEFMRPSVQGAAFRATESYESPGRVRTDGEINSDPNLERQ
jgi:hypothetical protein